MRISCGEFDVFPEHGFSFHDFIDFFQLFGNSFAFCTKLYTKMKKNIVGRFSSTNVAQFGENIPEIDAIINSHRTYDTTNESLFYQCLETKIPQK